MESSRDRSSSHPLRPAHQLLLPTVGRVRIVQYSVNHLVAALACIALAAAGDACFADVASNLSRPAASFDRSSLPNPANARKVRESGSLSGGKGSWGITGWFEYDLVLPASGWYQLKVRGNGAHVDYFLDGSPANPGDNGIRVYGSNGPNGGIDKIGNFWIDAGAHKLRVQRYFWTGFPDISEILLERSGDTLGESMRVWLEERPAIYRKDDCASLLVQTGGRTKPARLTGWVWNIATTAPVTKVYLDIPAGPALTTQKLSLPCDREGYFAIGFGENDARISPLSVRDIRYEVFDMTKPVGATKLERTLVQDIDMAGAKPDYASDAADAIAAGLPAPYRQSGTHGWLQYQSAASTPLKQIKQPSWFAYDLKGLKPQIPHLVEVDYPDDKLRTFAIALRESNPLSYPVAGGVDSGGEFSLSNRIQTQSLFFWPRSSDVRLGLLNAHDGRSAAAARARIYRIEGSLPALLPRSVVGGRHFANWYEEGSNFLSMYGAPDESALGIRKAAERWAEAVAYMGGDVLMPTAVIYTFALYPSKFNLVFGPPPDDDVLLRLMLVAEKYGLRVLPELHPRADELTWPLASESASTLKPGLLVSREGKNSTALPPLYDPLLPANQDWYVGMVGELADRYAKFPAMLGVSLRMMQWANPALNNFHSLDWGYGDATVSRFHEETGIDVPAGSQDDEARFGVRYRWLMANARDRWIEWRCEKVAQLFTRIRDRVRLARKDMDVYVNVFDAYPSQYGAGWLVGAGVCPARLQKIDGVILINALHAYGRRYDEPTTQGTRDNLVDAEALDSMAGGSRGAYFLTYARYMEATEAVMPPEQIGLPAQTKRTWMSAALSPAGDHSIERFAVELAQTDARFLGDGGNGYSLGQPALREFLAEFRRIPGIGFSARADARDPVAVWERKADGTLWFYVVNREAYRMTVTVHFSNRGKIMRAATDETLPESDTLRIDLPAYGLRVFRASSAMSISSVAIEVPRSQRQKIEERIRWLTAAAAERGGSPDGVNEAEAKLLRDAAVQARDALDRGWLWQARMLTERRWLLPVYRKLGRYPPGLRETAQR